MDLTFPLVPDDTTNAHPLFHSVDLPLSRLNYGKGVIYFTYHGDVPDLAEHLVAILPAYIQHTMGPELCTAWFHPGSLEAIGNVTFYHDDDGNWNGEWTTMEDDLAQDILDKDLGVLNWTISLT